MSIGYSSAQLALLALLTVKIWTLAHLLKSLRDSKP